MLICDMASLFMIMAFSLAACQEGILDGECFITFCDVFLDQTYCSVCTAMTEFLINGECLSTNTDNTCRHSFGNGTCDSCVGPYLSYKGGCYKVDENPGNYICAPENIFYIDGTALCKKCEVYNEFPIDGSCTSKAHGNVCGTKGYKGVCERCLNGYFYHNGGCYLKNRFPGNKVCRDTTPYENAGYCGSCLDGYETYRGKCLPCEDINCRKCSISSLYCELCQDGYYLDRNARDGRGECAPCATGSKCSTCISDDACTSCSRGFFAAFTSESGPCLSCEIASDNGYKGVQYCKECLPPPDNSPYLSVLCTECEDGFYVLTSKDGLKTECVSSCPKGKIPYFQHCIAEIAGCHKYGRNDECVACLAGYRLIDGICERCTIKDCDSCSTGSLICDSCKAGFGLVNGTCSPCGSQCRTCDGDTSICIACLVHTNYISPGHNCCISVCPENSNAIIDGDILFCRCFGSYKPSDDGLQCETSM